MVVYTLLVIVVGASGGMEGSISYIVVSTRETNILTFSHSKKSMRYEENLYGRCSVNDNRLTG